MLPVYTYSLFFSTFQLPFQEAVKNGEVEGKVEKKEEKKHQEAKKDVRIQPYSLQSIVMHLQNTLIYLGVEDVVTVRDLVWMCVLLVTLCILRAPKQMTKHTQKKTKQPKED